MSNPDKPFSAASERNREPILAVLREHFADRRHVLEIGSGTGQHAVCFAAALPQLIWAKRLRTNVWALTGVSIAVLVGMWLERILIILNTLSTGYEPSFWRTYAPTLVDFVILIGTLGAFVLLFLIFAADTNQLRAVRDAALERGLTLVPYVAAMFATGHDAANRAAFQAEDPNAPDLVGLALRGPKKAVDKTVKGLTLHG